MPAEPVKSFDFDVTFDPPQAVRNREEFDRLCPTWHETVTKFHQLMYASEIWSGVRWRGAAVGKLPTDLWIYQELVYEIQPDLIVETGSAMGGSAAFFASLLDLNQRGQIVSIDTVAAERPPHPRVSYWHGSSTDPAILDRLRPLASRAKSVMVTLDSAHSTEHVGRELALYSPLVTVGSYIVVEDGNVDGNPVLPGYVDFYDGQPGGPQTAIHAFLASTDKFEIDISRHKFLLTLNPNGYLRRVK
jgi:cephalosporin hydroxylase